MNRRRGVFLARCEENSSELRNQPFVPFAIRANDGSSFAIQHVDSCMVTQNAPYTYRDEVVRLAFSAITSLDSREPAEAGQRHFWSTGSQ